jgi:hypothetical protein
MACGAAGGYRAVHLYGALLVETAEEGLRKFVLGDVTVRVS